MSQVSPVNHEAGAYLYYAPVEDNANSITDYDGLDPYWTLSKLLIQHADGHHELDVDIAGETWKIRLTYSPSGIAPAFDHEIDSERLYEIEINAQGHGQRKCDYNLKPRFSDMRHYESGDPITSPFDHTEPETGLSVHAQPSNMALDEVSALLPRFIAELADDLDMRFYHGYFEAPFGGRITKLERYVRLLREMNEKIISNGGVLDRLGMLLSDVKGTKGQMKWDNEEVRGHHHVVRHGSEGSKQLCDRHRTGGQIKSYLPQHPENFSEEDPLYHPKLAVRFNSRRSNTGSIPWSERHELVKELDERLLSILTWADVPTDPGGTTYVADDHFQAERRDQTVPIHSDPLPRLEAEQDHLLLTTLRDMTDSDVTIVENLATDGGTHARDLASETELSISTVYRCLDRLDGVLTSDNGHVRFVSQKLRKEVRSVVESIENQVETAANRVAEIVDMDVRQSASSSFGRWLSKWAAEFDAPSSDDDTPVVRIDTALSELKYTSQPRLQDVVDEMLDSWDKDGRQVADLKDAIVQATVDGQTKRATVSALR